MIEQVFSSFFLYGRPKFLPKKFYELFSNVVRNKAVYQLISNDTYEFSLLKKDKQRHNYFV